MGHERVGVLPRTKEWRRLVADIATSADSPHAAGELAARTILNVRERFEALQHDSGFRAAFVFLLGLTTYQLSARNEPALYPALDLSDDPSSLRLTSWLRAWVDSHADSQEYAELAKRAAADAIVSWTVAHTRQHEAFARHSTASQIWADASTGAAFSDISRVFFGKFVERYLRYFLDREASAQFPSLEARERFAISLTKHVDAIAHHAFETTKIAQSFSAGWFNKYARTSKPEITAVDAFMAFTLGKLRQELQRESAER